jgi:hypothetical protein
VPAVIVAVTAPTAAKAMTATNRMTVGLGLRLGLVDCQFSSTQIGPIKRRRATITPKGHSEMHFSLVVVDGGNEMLAVETDANTVVSGTLVKGN